MESSVEQVGRAGRGAGAGRAGRRGRRKAKMGEIGVRYGEKNFLVTPGQGLVAQDGPWHLVVVPDWERDGWHNFKLYLDEKAPKNLFNLSINGQGVYGRRDAQILEEYFPGRLGWFEEMAKKYASGELPVQAERGRKVKYGKTGWRLVKKEQK